MLCDLSWSLWCEICQVHEYSYIWVICIMCDMQESIEIGMLKNFERQPFKREWFGIQFLGLNLGDSVYQLTWLWTNDAIRSWLNTEAESSKLDYKSN